MSGARILGGVSTDYLSAPAAAIAAPPLALAVWFKPNPKVDVMMLALSASGSGYNRFALATDFNGTMALAAQTAGPSSVAQAISSALIDTSGVWQHGLAGFSTISSRIVYLQGANSGTDNTSETPAGVNQTRMSGYAPTSGWYFNGELAHAAIYNRVPVAIEAAYLASGGHPRSVHGLIYYQTLVDGASPEVPEVGSYNLTVTGTTIGSDAPVISTWFTGATIANQVYTQGTAITPIGIAGEFDNVASAFTVALALLGSAGASTTASALGSASTIVPLTSATGFAAGDYLQIGSNAPALILAIIGSNALIAGAQTWSNGATVTDFPVTSPTLAGLAVTSGSWGGTPTGTQSATPNYFFRATNNTTAALVADSNFFSVTINGSSSPSAPSFVQHPQVTQQNTDGYVVSALPSAPCTGYLAAVLAGSSAPTASQIIAGPGASIIEVVSASLTAASTGSLTLTGLDLPIYDLYAVLSNTNGNSAVFPLTGQYRAPLNGQTFRVFTSVGAAGTLYSGIAQIGDVEETLAAITPGNEVMNYLGDGNDWWTVTATGRQMRTGRLYSLANQGWYIDDAGSATYTVYYENQPPTFVAVNPVIHLMQGQLISQVLDVTTYFNDPQGDPLTAISATPVPSGTQLSGNLLTGTPTVSGTFSAVVTVQNLALGQGTGTVTIIVAPAATTVIPNPPTSVTIIPLSPGLVNRQSSKLVDLDHTFGGDISPSNSGDVATVSGTEMGQQRIIRRLATNPGGSIVNPTYGAGLPGKIGAQSDPPAVQGLIEGQVLLEPSVAPNPRPVATVTPVASDPDTLSVGIRYTDVPSNEPTTVGFNISNTP